MQRRMLVLLSACAALVSALAAPAAVGQDFPSRTIRLVAPYPAGASDAIMRAVAEKLKAAWGQQVLVDPKPGASETIAASEVAHAKPDGYTWFMGTEATFANNPYLFRKLAFDATVDLVPVTELFVANYALIVRGDIAANSLKEFVELSRRSRPPLKYGTIGVGTGPHLAMETMLRAVGLPAGALLHVPYRTPPQAAQDMLGGNIDAVLSPPPFALPFLAGGKMKVLAITGSARMKELPETPTFAELGYPNVSYRTSFGLAVPKGTPPDIVQKIAAGVREALAAPDIQEKLLRPSAFEMVASDPRAFTQALAERRRDAKRVIDALEIRLD